MIGKPNNKKKSLNARKPTGGNRIAKNRALSTPPVFCVVFFFWGLFLLPIVSSDLVSSVQITDSGYPVGIFKPF